MHLTQTSLLQTNRGTSASKAAISQFSNQNVLLAGIIHHGAEISMNSLKFLLEATCVNQVRAHILGADDMTALVAIYDRLKEVEFGGKHCASFEVSSQPEYVTALTNRIDRIQAARDYQRIAIDELFYFPDLDKVTIILADFDVHQLPPLDKVIGHANGINNRLNGVDVLCSSGKMLNPYGYYDIFATILLPDTFVYPVNGRPEMKARPEEDASMIIDNNFTSLDLLEWFYKEGGAAAKPVPVKSCFGGLTMYRASKWLDQRCSYKNQKPGINAKYANRFDNAPCEHVVFHNCLQEVDPKVVVAVQPDMHTLWRTSAGPQYALSNYSDIAADFLRERLKLVPSSAHDFRHLQVAIESASLIDATSNNSTNSTRFMVASMLEVVQEIFNVHCPDCTEIPPERRLAGTNELIRFLYEGPVDCVNTTANCTTGTRSIAEIIKFEFVFANNSSIGNGTNTTTGSARDLEYGKTSELDFHELTVSSNAAETNMNQLGKTSELDLDILTVSSDAAETNRNLKLDFFIAGFPKCGTTSLLFAFNSNSETAVGENEHCSIASDGLSDEAALEHLDHELSQLTQDSSVKRGLKCPLGISNYNALHRLTQHSPETKLLIGLRHPVEYFQSYYNYRITEMYDKNLPLDEIPAIESLVGQNEWKGVSTDTARFELYLTQLSKTDVSAAEIIEISERPNLAFKTNKFKVFLYTLAQMEDETEERKSKFNYQMSSFLSLEKPLEMEHRNKNNFVGDHAYKETVDICESKYDGLRALLIEQGKYTQKWIREEFIRSPDVFIANEDHFLAIIDTWNNDPCHNDIVGDNNSIGAGNWTGRLWLFITELIMYLITMIDSIFR